MTATPFTQELQAEESPIDEGINPPIEKDDYIQQLHASSEKLVSPETREKLANAFILVGGCGSVGGNMAKMSIQEGAMNLIIADPDSVEVKNLNRQPYTKNQVGENKAEALKETLYGINPHARIQVHTEGLTEQNLKYLVHQSDIVLDGIDIEALDVMFELHYYASLYKKPVIVGYDLAQTGIIVTYRYDLKDMEPLDGAIKPEVLETYKKIRDAYKSGKISKARFLDFLYNAFVGPVNPLHVPPEFFEELISRNSEDTKSYQLPRTSQLVSTMTIQQIINILEKKKTKFVSRIDLAGITSKGRPGILKRAKLMKNALGVVKQRSERVKDTLKDLNLDEL